MRKRRITIVNELPELLEAVCEHPDCPEWLKHDIWDSFNDNTTRGITYKASYWRSYLDEGVPMDDPRDRDKCRMGCGADLCDAGDAFGFCLDCVEKTLDRKRSGQWPEEFETEATQ